MPIILLGEQAALFSVWIPDSTLTVPETPGLKQLKNAPIPNMAVFQQGDILLKSAKLTAYVFEVEAKDRHIMQCNRTLIGCYVRNELSGDQLLDFLLHVDDCSVCRNAVFEERQRQDARFFRRARPHPLGAASDREHRAG